jgi:hypothetical protein
VIIFAMLVPAMMLILVLALSLYEDNMFRPRPARVSRRSRPSKPLAIDKG